MTSPQSFHVGVCNTIQRLKLDVQLYKHSTTGRLLGRLQIPRLTLHGSLPILFFRESIEAFNYMVSALISNWIFHSNVANTLRMVKRYKMLNFVPLSIVLNLGLSIVLIKGFYWRKCYCPNKSILYLIVYNRIFFGRDWEAFKLNYINSTHLRWKTMFLLTFNIFMWTLFSLEYTVLILDCWQKWYNRSCQCTRVSKGS